MVCAYALEGVALGQYCATKLTESKVSKALRLLGDLPTETLMEYNVMPVPAALSWQKLLSFVKKAYFSDCYSLQSSSLNSICKLTDFFSIILHHVQPHQKPRP